MASTDDASYAANGISVRRPRAPRRPQCLFDAAPEAPPSNTNEGSDEDAEAGAMLQELAYQYAMEQMRSTVRAILLAANESRYNEVHAFFQRYLGPRRGASTRSPAVAFPLLSKFPAAAIVSGSDATFSEVWMGPLCRVIHRSFPLIAVVRDDVQDARQMIEWLLERLHEYVELRQQEAQWLARQLNDRDLPIRGEFKNGAADELVIVPKRSTKMDNTVEEPELEEDALSDDSVENGKPRTKKTRATKTPEQRRIKGYATTATDDLITELRRKLDILRDEVDPCSVVHKALCGIVLDTVRHSAAQCGGDIERLIRCYDDQIQWVKGRIFEHRQVFQSRLGSLRTNLHLGSVEYALAQLMHRIMCDFIGMLESFESSVPTHKLVRTWLQQMKTSKQRHEDAYNLRRFDSPNVDSGDGELEPFLLLCVEHLDGFNLSALQDFLDIWSTYTALRNESSRQCSTRLGFIFGVTSTTSPALRVLGLPTIRRLDMQFFPLSDSKTRAEDIVEALIVNNGFPLCIRGDLLQLVNDRHLTSQSLTSFMMVLEFIAFTHFRQVKWSFLSHFAIEDHCDRPLHKILNPSESLLRWMKRRGITESSLRACLGIFSKVALKDLHNLGSVAMDKQDWMGQLDDCLQEFCQAQTRWTTGWKCFRAACAWLDAKGRGEGFTDCLAMALDGTIKCSKSAEWIGITVHTVPLALVVNLLEEWRHLLQVARVDSELLRDVGELLFLCQYVQDHSDDMEACEMKSSVRAEIADVFSCRILKMMERTPTRDGAFDDAIQAWVTPQSTRGLAERMLLNQYEAAEGVLNDLEDREYREATWVSDVSLAFYFVKDSAGMHINLAEWFAAFSAAVREEADGEAAAIDGDGLNARFARALATLRLWGYIKGPDGLRRRGSSHQDLYVEKRIFL